jgi:hypothetical protein
VYLDPLDDPRVIAAIQKGHDADAKFKAEMLRVGAENEELSKSEVRKIVMDNLEVEERVSTTKEAVQAMKKNRMGQEMKRLTEMSRIPDLILVSGMGTPDVEAYFGQELDDHCVLLESTPRLQDKALRCVFSVGCELAIVDAELSAMLPKITLNPIDLLTADETNEVFGNFGVQREGGDSDEEGDDSDDE